MEKLARNIHYSLQIQNSKEYRNWLSQPWHHFQSVESRWGPRFMNPITIEAYGNFTSNNSLETIKRKLHMMKKLTSREKALLTRLYHPSFMGIAANARDNAKIKPVRNWYLGVLAKKYNVPKNWLSEVVAISESRPGKYIEYALTKKYTPQNVLDRNLGIARKQLARRVSSAYTGLLERRIAAAKKATRTLPSPIRKNIMNRAFPGTRRHRSPSVGRTFQ